MRFFDPNFRGIFTLKIKKNLHEIGYNPDDEGNLIYSEDDRSIMYGDSSEMPKLGGYKYVGNSDVKLCDPIIKSFLIESSVDKLESLYLYFAPLKDWNIKLPITLNIYYRYSSQGSPIELDLKFYDVNNRDSYYFSKSIELITSSDINKLSMNSISITILDFIQLIKIDRLNDLFNGIFTIDIITFSQLSPTLNILVPLPITNISEPSYIVSKVNSYKHYTTFNCLTDVTITIPYPEMGLYLSFSKDSPVNITIKTPDNSYTYINNVFTSISSINKNDRSGFVSLIGIDTKTYIVQEMESKDTLVFSNPVPNLSLITSSFSSTFTNELKRVKSVNDSISAIISSVGTFSSSPLCKNAILLADGNIYAILHDKKRMLKIFNDGVEESIIPNTISSDMIGVSPKLSYTASGDILTLSSTTKYNVKISFNSVKFGFSSLNNSYVAPPDFSCGIFTSSGYTYLIPYSITSIHKFKTKIEKCIDLKSSNGWMGACLGPDENIYLIPSNSTEIAKYLPLSNTIIYYGSLESSQNKWSGGVIDRYGFIYGVPYDSNSILRITPGPDLKPPQLFATLSSDPGKWSGGVLGPDGNIYCIPYNSTTILKIVPGSNNFANPSYELIQLPDDIKNGEGKWSGGVLAPDGNIYGIPYNSTTVLKISFNNLKENYHIQYLLSSYLNKF